jgi:hypothetical protein
MAYRNKTFVSFASEDIQSYWMMTAWKANQHIDFDFHDAHDLNTALDSSLPETIERRLSERLANTKQVVMLIGDVTRRKAGDGVSFLHHEVTVIKRLQLPVVFANLNKMRTVQSARIPRALEDLYTVSVSFQPAIIKYALDNFVDGYQKDKLTKVGPHQYNESVYKDLGI